MSNPNLSPGAQFRSAVANAMIAGTPLHIIGVADGSDALEARKAGFSAIYLSGNQMAAARGWADIGRLELKHVTEHVRSIIDSDAGLPLLVDIDTGFDDVAETMRTLEELGAGAVHLEDQQDLKACGHLPGKHVISIEAATARIARAVQAKKNPDFVLIARTDSYAVEGLEKALDRIASYSNAGADMIFPEAFPDFSTYNAVKTAAGGKPVLANMTEFGLIALKTPAETALATGNSVDMVLNPLTVYRAQRKTAELMYKKIYELGSQRDLLTALQTREYFQQLIDYPGQVAARAKELEVLKNEPAGQ